MATEFGGGEADPARALGDRIRALARQDDYRALLEIDQDPHTAPLLARLPLETQRAVAIHLEGARRWRRQRERANRRRLREAQEAIDAFDLAFARSLLHRLEDEYLADDDAAARDALLLALEARAMETEELSGAASDVLDQHRPHRRRWWRRRSP